MIDTRYSWNTANVGAKLQSINQPNENFYFILFSDITNMTEEKIQKIQDYIKTHTCTDCLSDDSISNSSPRKSKKVCIYYVATARHKMH